MSVELGQLLWGYNEACASQTNHVIASRAPQCRPIDLYHSIVSRPIILNHQACTPGGQSISYSLGGLHLHGFLGGVGKTQFQCVIFPSMVQAVYRS